MKQINHTGNALLYATMILLLLIPASLHAQTYQLSGTVHDSQGLPLTGATIKIKGSAIGTVADIDGSFRLQVLPQSVIEASFVGFETREIPVDNRLVVHIVLDESAQMLEETIVIGYGTLKKSDLTGAITSVNVDDLASRATTNPAEALQGKVAGVNVLKTGGNAGASVNIKIRGIKSMGSNNPLYIIDGFVGDINTVNPNDIAAMEVLKDGAAAAIYGSVAANGVIIITTKNGKKGEVKVDFGAYYAFTSIAKKMEMLNAAEYLDVHNRMYQNAIDDWGEQRYAKPNYLLFTDNAGRMINPTGFDTDWQDEALRNGLTQNYNVSIRGGSDYGNYSISYNHADDKGIFLGNDHRKDNARAKLYMRKHVFEFDANIAMQIIKNNQPQYSLKEMYMLAPLVPVLDANQSSGYGLTDMSVDGRDLQLPSNRNIMADHHFKGVRPHSYDYNANMGITVNFAPWLKYRTAYSYAGFHGNTRTHVTPYIANIREPVLYVNNADYNSHYREHLFDNTLTFDKTFDKHSLTAMIGSSVMDRSVEGSWVNVEGKTLVNEIVNGQIVSTEVAAGFPDPDSWGISAGTGGTFSGGDYEGFWKYRRASFFGRLNYSYGGKYLAQVTFRSDGSSKFGSQERWGYFPSVALGWRISEEDFFPQDIVMNNLKLRCSWGRLGNEDALGYYGFAQSLTTSNTQWLSYLQGGNPMLGGNFLYLINQGIHWETTDTKNVGVDFGFLRNKLSGAINYYYNKTEDMLIEKMLPPSAGLYNSVVNVGTMRNTGIEIEANWTDSYDGFDWNVGLNFATLSNRLLEGDPNNILYGEGLKFGTEHFPTQTFEGRPVASFFVYKTNGIFQSNEEAAAYVNDRGERLQPDAFAGDIRFVDVNGDGVINDDDKVYAGSGMPRVEANLTFQGAYKGFDLSLLIGSGFGHKLYNGNRYLYEGMNSGSNFLKSALDAWRPDNANTSVPRPVMDDFNGNTRESDRFVEKGDFIRLRQLQIGYTLPVTLTNRAYIDKCRVYVSGENLWTGTKYSGIDPEFSRDNVLNTGIDNLIFPFTRTFIAGVQLTF